MARVLGPLSYGAFASFIAALGILAAPSSALLPLVTKQVAYLNENNNKNAIVNLYKKYLLIFICSLITYLLVVYFYGENISSLLDIQITMISWVGIAAFSLIMLSVTSGVFFGTQKYRIAAYVSIFFSVIKIVICSFLVLLGLGAFGASLGIAIAALVTIFFAGFQIVRAYQFKSESNIKANKLDVKSIFLILAANIFFSVMVQSDVIIVNFFFGSSEGGIYAAAATLARSILYLPSGLAIALLSTSSKLQTESSFEPENLINMLALTGIFCLIAAFLMSLFSDLIISLAFGKSYMAASEFLGWYSFIMIPWSLLIVLENYLIAHGKYFLTWIYFVGVLVGYVFISYFHMNTFTILGIFGFMGVIISLIGLIYVWIEFSPSTNSNF